MSKLWAILVTGSEEYAAAPSEDAAKHMEQRHVAAMQDYIAKNNLDWAKDMCLASVVEWPFSPEEHAEELAQFDYEAWGLKGDVATQDCIAKSKQEGGAA